MILALRKKMTIIILYLRNWSFYYTEKCADADNDTNNNNKRSKSKKNPA